jgi:hypothetical protein
MGHKSKKSNQQKPPSTTKKTVTQPKPEEPAKPTATNTAANLCDECAYEYGACDGIPKFASEADPTLKGTEADRVISCQGFRNVQDMPTEDQKKEPPAPPSAEEPAAEPPPAEPVHVVEKPGATAAEKKADEKTMKADLEKRKKLQRFQREEDLGKCPACDRPLKRTAFNRNRDAVRCTNPRCRQYRAVVRNIPAE